MSLSNDIEIFATRVKILEAERFAFAKQLDDEIERHRQTKAKIDELVNENNALSLRVEQLAEALDQYTMETLKSE